MELWDPDTALGIPHHLSRELVSASLRSPPEKTFTLLSHDPIYALEDGLLRRRPGNNAGLHQPGIYPAVRKILNAAVDRMLRFRR